MKKTLLQIGLFFTTLTGHLFFTNWQTIPNIEILLDQSATEFILLYIQTVSFIPGLAYALMASFAGYAGYKIALLRSENSRSGSTKNSKIELQGISKVAYCPAPFIVWRGIGIASLLFAILYFGFGLNGSVFFYFYVQKLSWIYSSLIKPLFLLITIISVLTGYIYIWRKTKIFIVR